MLAATAKIGSKYLVNVEILKALGAELEQLPEKEKVMFDFKSAVAFLRPFLELAIKKNYTKDEIFQIMVKVGWGITHNTFKYFWSLFMLEQETSGKKKSVPKPPRKSRSVTTLTSIEQDKTQSLENQNPASSIEDNKLNENEISASNAQKSNAGEMSAKEISTHENSADNPAQTNSAHFELPPDTEDL